jgi:hypothetical protein
VTTFLSSKTGWPSNLFTAQYYTTPFGFALNISMAAADGVATSAFALYNSYAIGEFADLSTIMESGAFIGLMARQSSVQIDPRFYVPTAPYSPTPNPRPAPAPESSNSSFIGIFLGVFGGVFVLLVIFAISFVFCRRRRMFGAAAVIAPRQDAVVVQTAPAVHVTNVYATQAPDPNAAYMQSQPGGYPPQQPGMYPPPGQQPGPYPPQGYAPTPQGGYPPNYYQ